MTLPFLFALLDCMQARLCQAALHTAACNDEPSITPSAANYNLFHSTGHGSFQLKLDESEEDKSESEEDESEEDESEEDEDDREMESVRARNMLDHCNTYDEVEARLRAEIELFR